MTFPLKSLLSLIPSIAFAVALLACGDGGQNSQAPAPKPEAKAPTTPSAPTPASAGDKCAPPSGDLRGSAAAGAKTYGLYCALCHGQSGKGDGPGAPKDPKPADHTDATYMATLEDGDLFKVICGGGTAIGKSPLMAPWGAVLPADQIRDVIAHVRSLSGT